MFLRAFHSIFKLTIYSPTSCFSVTRNGIHTSAVLAKRQSSRHKKTRLRDNPVTYEQYYAHYFIAVRKSWNSWNTSNLLDGLRKSETAVEDLFIRKFIEGTWHKLFLSEVIIKRRANLVIIGGIISQSILARKIYFLIGYTEELLSYVLKCPVKLELQTAASREDLVVKYV